MASYEQLGLLYLGRRYDLATRTRLVEPVLYDSKDLVTHAVCVGMTGSGKTGLGVTLIEEAAIDGVPVLAIDPKGDLGNLLLTFPALEAADFAPWAAHDPAAPTHEPGAREAALWRAGLTEWDQGPDRIARLQAAADIRVYTPGSRAGVPLALLGSLLPPAGAHEEDLAVWAGGVASSLLSLAGLDPEPLSREHTLVSTILTQATGRADLPWLVQQIQRPAFSSVGVLDLETFFPARDRQAVALRFNSVLASPGFGVWLSGEPLDVSAMLFTPEGRPRVAIVSVAHLEEGQRMMAVSMLLNAVLAWTRRQSGTTSLRAMVYMDEVFGYLPPVANPPSKLPLLTLLKQARAFGTGIVLATQNPVDLDYKALSNTGTWFLGKLQTERDKARVLDGIEGLTSSWNRETLDRTLSALRSRVFLMHNVHEPEPVLFETRWTLSYLRGPMTREELTRAAAGRAAPEAASDARAVDGRPADARGLTPPSGAGERTAGGPASAGNSTPPAGTVLRPPAPSSHQKPVLPAGISEFYLPAGSTSAPRQWTPVLYGAARVQFADARHGVHEEVNVQALTAFDSGAVAVDWERAAMCDMTPDDLETPSDTREGAHVGPPAAALSPKAYAAWHKDFEGWLARTQTLQLRSAPSLKLVSKASESERDFSIRVQQAAREARDAAVEKLRARYAPKVQRLTSAVRAAEAAVVREQQQATQQKLQSAVSIGSTLLGAIMGRKAVSMATLGRATTAARGVSRTMKESQDIAAAEERVRTAQAALVLLDAELAEEVRQIEAQWAGAVPIQTITIKPKRGGIDVRLVSLVWQPE